MSKADIVVEQFLNQTKTTSINTLAKAQGGVQSHERNEIVWDFDDGSQVRTTGRGKSHQFWAAK
jgi:hypothetical protein